MSLIKTSCLVGTWILLWLAVNIFWAFHYAYYHSASDITPAGSIFPPTLSYQILDISSDSLTIDGVKMNDTRITFN